VQRAQQTKAGKCGRNYKGIRDALPLLHNPCRHQSHWFPMVHLSISPLVCYNLPLKVLESNNPSKRPARSNLVDGNWRLLWSDAPGFSSGMVGPFQGDAFQDVVIAQKQYTNILNLWGTNGKPFFEVRHINC